MLHFADTSNSKKLKVCRCPRGYRSVSGRGHVHCHICRSTFQFRPQLFAHEKNVHGITRTHSVVKTKTSSNSVMKGMLQSQSLNGNKSKKSDEFSCEAANAGDHQVIRKPEHTAEISPAESDSVNNRLSQQHQSSVRSESEMGKNADETNERIAETLLAESVSLELRTAPAKTVGTFPAQKDASNKNAKRLDSGVEDNHYKKCDELLHEDSNAGGDHVIRITGQADETSSCELVSLQIFPPYKSAGRKKLKQSNIDDGESDGKKCNELSSKGKNVGYGYDVRTTEHSVSEKTFPPYKVVSGKKRKQSYTDDMNSDSEKYAKQITICADGKKVISRVPCYSGNAVFPSVVSLGQKVRCPVCSKLFKWTKTFRNHVICVHNALCSGETLYSCIPCSYKTSIGSVFKRHQVTKGHRANLRHSSGNSDNFESKPQQLPSLAALFSQQRAVQSFYGNTTVMKAVEKKPPRVVWLGHLDHVCSSQCLSGLTTDLSSEDEKVSTQVLRPRKPVDPPVATVPTAPTSVDVSNETRKMKSSVTYVPEKATAGKSAKRSPMLASKFGDKKKEAAAEPHIVHSILKSVETHVTESANAKASSPKKAIMIIDSDSDSQEVADVKTSRRVTRLSSSGRNQRSSHITKPSTSSANKRKYSLSKKSTDVSGHMKAVTSKSPCPTGSQKMEALQVSSSDSGGNPSVATIAPQSSCKLTASVAVTSPAVVSTAQQVPASSFTRVNNPVLTDSAIVTPVSSAALRSAPVIGVAKAVQSETTPTQTTASMNRSIYSLHRFSADTLWSELCRRGGMRSCDCGISFMDTTLYLLHRSCHSDLAPLKCAFCNHKSATCYDFHAHLLDHKK